MAWAAASKRSSAMAMSIACTVATVSATIQRLTGASAWGASWLVAAATPLDCRKRAAFHSRSEEHTSELQSLMRISYAVFCLKKKKNYIERLRYLNSVELAAAVSHIAHTHDLPL